MVGFGGGGEGGRPRREGIYVYIELIHFIVQQKIAQHGKVIILQLKKKAQPNVKRLAKGRS